MAGGLTLLLLLPPTFRFSSTSSTMVPHGTSSARHRHRHRLRHSFHLRSLHMMKSRDPHQSSSLTTTRSSSDQQPPESQDKLESNRPSSISEIAKHMQTSMQIFVIVLIYIVYFFGTSAWDGKGKNR